MGFYWDIIRSWFTPIRLPGSESSQAKKPSPYHRQLNTPVEKLNDDERRRQLSGAIHWGHEQRIDELFAVSTDFLSKPAKYSSKTWLDEAVSHECNHSILGKLLAAGCDPNAPSQEKNRPLESAIHKERTDTVQWLLDNGADPNLGRPLVSAVNRQRPELQLEILALLIAAGVDVNRSYAYFGDESNRFTALDMAKSEETIKFLRQHGAKHYSEL